MRLNSVGESGDLSIFSEGTDLSTLTGTSTMAINEQKQAEGFSCVACSRQQQVGSPVLRAPHAHLPFDLLQCRHCGVVQSYPRRTPGEITAQYGEDYYVFAEEESDRWARAVQQYVVHLLRWETGAMRRLLDVGCALGHATALAAERGWRVTGIDVSGEAVSRAAIRFGLDFRAGTVGRFRDTLPPFDVVFLGDVIEHVPRPGEFLGAVRQVLAPGGVVCIDTPNWGSRWRRYGRGRWIGLNKYHVNLFDAQALGGMLRAAGFGDIATGSYTHYRYEDWANRPEVQTFVQKLPRMLTWRINRRLSRRGVGKPWAPLRRSPPASLAQARTSVDELAHLRSLCEGAPASGDNLAVFAKRD
jgi:SAM-dependent methyltransferase